MANIKHEKFISGSKTGLNKFAAYRIINNNGTELIFAIAGTDLAVLKNGYENYDLDKESDDILAKRIEEKNGYYRWVGHQFISCDKNEIL